MTVNAGRVVARLLLGATMLGGTGSVARAQMPVPGGTGVTGMQSPAVFGGARREAPGSNNVTLSVSTMAGYDTNILIENLGVGGGGGGPTGSSDATDSTFAGGNASLEWSRSGRRSSYFGSLAADYRKFFDVDNFDIVAGSAIAGVSYQISPRQTFSVNGQGGVQPFYQFGAIGGTAPGLPSSPPGDAFAPDMLAAREQVLRYGFGTSYQYELTPRTRLTAFGSRTGFEPINEAADAAGLAALGGTSVGARLTYAINRKVGLRAGYGYSRFDGVSPGGVDADGNRLEETFQNHNLDVGVNYHDGLTIAPRTTFSFGTGTIITQNSSGAASVNSGPTLSVVGFASLEKEFLRSWSAALTYNRSVAYIEVTNSIGTFDAASASVSGLFTDRVDASAAVSYIRGAPFTNNADPVASFSAGAQLRYAFSTHAATFVSYSYGYFDQPVFAGAPVGTRPFRPERQGVRFGLSLWFDLLH